MDYTKDFLDIHNDDLIPIDVYEGIVLYEVNYEQAERRMIEFIQKLIAMRKEKEK